MKNELLTIHGTERMHERIGTSNSKLNRLLCQAFRCGKTIEDLPNSRLKEYMKNKARAKGNRGRVEFRYFDGYVWIKSLNKQKLVTVYEVPKNIMRDYNRKVIKKPRPRINIEDRDDYWQYE